MARVRRGARGARGDPRRRGRSLRAQLGDHARRPLHRATCAPPTLWRRCRSARSSTRRPAVHVGAGRRLRRAPTTSSSCAGTGARRSRGTKCASSSRRRAAATSAAGRDRHAAHRSRRGAAVRARAGGRRISDAARHRHRDAARVGLSLAGGPPVFLGATAYGGARPDVAAVHGDRFRDPASACWCRASRRALRSGRVRLEHRAGRLRARPDRAGDRASIESCTRRFSRLQLIVRTHPARRLLPFAIQEVPRWEDARFGMRAHKKSTLCVRAVEV